MAAAPAAAPKVTAPASLTPVTILEGGRVVGWAPGHLALDRGFFRERGLEADWVTASQGAVAAVAAVVGGNAFMACTGAPVATNAVRQNLPVRIVLVASNQYGVEVTVSNKLLQDKGVTPESPIEARVQALKGAKIGIYTPGDSTDQLLRYLFRQYNVNADTEVELVSLQNAANILAGFQRGSVDAMSVSPPTGQQAEATGQAKVFIKAKDVPEIAGYPYLVGTVGMKDIQERPELVKGAIAGFAMAERMLRTDPNGAKPSVRKFFENFDQQVFDLAYASMLEAVPANPIPTRESFQALESFARLQGQPLGINYEQAMDPRLAEEVVKELGG